MIIKFKSWKSYLACDSPRLELNGPSPGGAASLLAVSRQTIHQWIDAGLLDYVEIWQGGKFEAGVVPLGSIDRLADLIKRHKLGLGKGGRGSSGVVDEALRLLGEKHPGLYTKPKSQKLRATV